MFIRFTWHKARQHNKNKNELFSALYLSFLKHFSITTKFHKWEQIAQKFKIMDVGKEKNFLLENI